MAKKILVVDDEENVREVTAMSLEVMGGYETLKATNGVECIERARSEKPDAILLDVMMPGMDGPRTFKELQSHEDLRDIPVILLTAKVQAADRARFSGLGVVGLITKPFDPASLHVEVARLLGWPVQG